MVKPNIPIWADNGPRPLPASLSSEQCPPSALLVRFSPKMGYDSSGITQEIRRKPSKPQNYQSQSSRASDSPRSLRGSQPFSSRSVPGSSIRCHLSLLLPPRGSLTPLLVASLVIKRESISALGLSSHIWISTEIKGEVNPYLGCDAEQIVPCASVKPSLPFLIHFEIYPDTTLPMKPGMSKFPFVHCKSRYILARAYLSIKNLPSSPEGFLVFQRNSRDIIAVASVRKGPLAVPPHSGEQDPMKPLLKWLQRS